MHRKPFALLLCFVLCLFSAFSKILGHWCFQSTEGHRSINVLPFTDATSGMQYRKYCQRLLMRPAGTRSSHLALMFALGFFKAISFLCYLLYMWEISLHFLFRSTVQLSWTEEQFWGIPQQEHVLDLQTAMLEFQEMQTQSRVPK